MRVDDHRLAPPRARRTAVTRPAVHGNFVDGEHVVLALLVLGLRGAGVLYLFDV